MIRSKLVFCCIFLFNVSICVCQKTSNIKDSLIANYVGFNLLNKTDVNCPAKLGKNLFEILSNEHFFFKFLVEVEYEKDLSFNQFILFSFKNLGSYSYCEKPCDSNSEAFFEKYTISTGKLFGSQYKSKSGLVAYDTILKKMYFVSGFDIQLDLMFYKEINDKERKIKLFTYAYQSYYKKRKFSRYYVLENKKIFFKKGMPTFR